MQHIRPLSQPPKPGNLMKASITARLLAVGGIVLVGKKVAQLRKLKDWTQDDLAKMLNVHKSHVSRWESGRMLPKVDTLKRLAEVLGVGLDELTGDFSSSAVNRDVSQMVRDLDSLAEDDRLVVRKVIDAMLTKQRMKQALGA